MVRQHEASLMRTSPVWCSSGCISSCKTQTSLEVVMCMRRAGLDSHPCGCTCKVGAYLELASIDALPSSASPCRKSITHQCVG